MFPRSHLEPIPEDEHVRCPACRLACAPGEGFCEGCGARVPGRGAPERAAIACPRCDTINRADDPVCHRCASVLEEGLLCPGCLLTVATGSRRCPWCARGLHSLRVRRPRCPGCRSFASTRKGILTMGDVVAFIAASAGIGGFMWLLFPTNSADGPGLFRIFVLGGIIFTLFGVTTGSRGRQRVLDCPLCGLDALPLGVGSRTAVVRDLSVALGIFCALLLYFQLLVHV